MRSRLIATRSHREFVCIARAACLLVVYAAVLRFCPAHLLRSPPTIAAVRRTTLWPEQAVRAVAAASRVVGGTCLARALVARVLLARAGVPVAVVLGAATADHPALLRAHAWIEHDGRPIVCGELAPSFTAVWRLSPRKVR